MDLFLGIDLGASSLKVALVDKTGQPVDTARGDIEHKPPPAGFSEQDPADWRDALADACHALAGRQADGLSHVKALRFRVARILPFCAMPAAQPLRPAIMWTTNARPMKRGVWPRRAKWKNFRQSPASHMDIAAAYLAGTP